MEIVYCIIVTFNGMEWIDKCVRSVLSSTYPVRIILVDNDSSDGTVGYVKRNFASLVMIENRYNAGFGQANNVGLRIALENNAGFIFLLNQDAWVERDTIEILIKVQRQKPEFGILSPLHLNGKGTDLDKYFAGYLKTATGNDVPLPPLLHQSTTPQLRAATFVNAAAWMISRDCLIKTGGFDPIFFHYGEDINYSQRTIFNGFKIGIYTGARIYHDRENRLSKPAKDSSSRVQKDYIQFLNQVCDISQPLFRRIILRRLARYSSLMVVRLLFFDNNGMRYNYGMAKRILISIPKIFRSRTRSKSSFSFPHLS